MHLVKAHAYGNDFLLARRSEAPGDLAALARAVCERHRGIGADGLILYEPRDRGASMRLLNADGSRSEISGNGVRCLAAWLAAQTGTGAGVSIDVETEAGEKRLQLLDTNSGRYLFRAAMGFPAKVQRTTLDVHGTRVEAVTMRVGNPQCVVLGEVSEARLHSIGAALAVHPHFAEGTNVELAHVESADCVRILIWERGVGPTEASGTGACAAAVAAAAFGGAARDVAVVSPGGSQRVEWRDDGLYLTGWAELIAEATWIGTGPA